MKLENVKVGMRVFVKDREHSKANGQWLGKIGTVTDSDRSDGGSYNTDYQIELQFPCGRTDIMDARDIRKVKDGE